MLVVLSGLPGTGKTTICKIVARECQATYLRIDTVEQAILSSLSIPSDLGIAGYVVAYELARTNLCLGDVVIADAVNPLSATRKAWREVAESANADIIEIEIVCSDKSEHRTRVESRKADIAGHVLPTWDEVQRREYEPWQGECIVIDSSVMSAEDAAARILAVLESRQQ
jgi:predicted kinase